METSRKERIGTGGRTCRKDGEVETSNGKTVAPKLVSARGLGVQENMRRFAKGDKSNASQHGSEASIPGVPSRHTPVLEDSS